MAGTITSKIRDLGELLKISHTIFALPFALSAMLAAAGGLPSPRLTLLIILAMFLARNAGMSFNRYLDADIDAKNPRTAARHIPRGVFSKGFVLWFSIVNAFFFSATTFFINAPCFALSPVALLLLYGYSTTKRFTALSHLFLGLVLGASPVAGWLAVRGSFDPPPVFLGLAVLFWVAGFDILYATQDHDFDRREGLHSAVVSLGVSKALLLARSSHALTVLLLFVFGMGLYLSWPYFAGLVLVAALLIYEHSLVSAQDLSRVNSAFFNVNGFISLLFLAGVALSI